MLLFAELLPVSTALEWLKLSDTVDNLTWDGGLSGLLGGSGGASQPIDCGLQKFILRERASVIGGYIGRRKDPRGHPRSKSEQSHNIDN
jgi:hypothetical protein